MPSILEKYRMVLAPEGPSGGGSAPGGAGSGGAPSTSSGSAGSSPSAPASTPSGGSAGVASTAAPSDDGGDVAPSPSSSDMDYSIFFGDSPPADDFVQPPEPQQSATPTAAKPTPTTSPQAQQPVAQEPPAQVQPVVEQRPAAQGVQDQRPPQSGQEQPALDPYDPGALAAHLTAIESQATEWVAQSMFQMSPEMREALEQDVIGTIPKLLASVYVKSQQNVLRQIERLIPTMVQRHTEAMHKNMENQGLFYQRWPEIKQAAHGALVTRYASVYRQMHPQATLEQMIEDLGPMVMMAARITPSSFSPPTGGQPVVGQVGRVPANGRPPQPHPFVPAGANAGPVSQSRAPEKQAWEVMWEPQGGG